MVFMVCLPPLTAELEVTTIDVAVALIGHLVLLARRRTLRESWRSDNGGESGDSKKLFHGVTAA
jgi:hypothetical protein